MDLVKGFSRERPPAVVLGDLALVRPLGMAGIPVVLGSSRPHDETLRSRHVRGAFVVPGWTGERSSSSARTLVEVGARLSDALGRKVPLVYQSDVHLDMIYRHRAELSEHFLFVLNDEGLAWALHDKARFHEVALAAGIRIPATLASGADIEARLGELREPFVVKPKRKVGYKQIQLELFGGRGKARVFRTRGELLHHPAFERHKDALVVQEHIDGRVEDLVSFHAFADETGRILASFCGVKIRTCPMFGGESACIELREDGAVDAIGREVAGKLGLKGPFKIDLIRERRTGELFVLEINARFNLWHHLGALHGVNLPLVAYEHLVHGRAAPSAFVPEPSRRWVDFFRDLQAFRELRAEGTPSLPRWLLSVASPRNVFAVFAWDDPAPFAAWAWGELRRRMRDGALRRRV